MQQESAYWYVCRLSTGEVTVTIIESLTFLINFWIIVDRQQKDFFVRVNMPLRLVYMIRGPFLTSPLAPRGEFHPFVHPQV
jgi:hypothetical protein